MAKINLTPPEFAITVGGLDITPMVTQINLRQSALDIRYPIVWQGTIDIAKTTKWTGESLDDFANPTRWARGKHQVILAIAGATFATLRISQYVYDEDSDAAQITVSQLLDLLDYRTPPEDYKALSNSPCSASLSGTVSDLLEMAGITNYSLAGYTEGERIATPDRVNRSYIELAQEILGERGYWLYHEKDEMVKVKKISFSATKSFERERGQLVEFNRQPQRGIVANLYRVVGGGEVCENACSLGDAVNRTEEIYGDRVSKAGYFYKGEYRSLYTSRRRAIVGRVVTRLITDTPSFISTKQTTYKDLKVPKEDGTEVSFLLAKVSEIVTNRYYDRQGRLIKEVQSESAIAKDRFPGTKYDLHPYALEWVNDLEVRTTEYSHDPGALNTYAGYSSSRRYDKNVLRIRSQTVTRTFLNTVIIKVGTAVTTSSEFYKAPKEQTVETWVEKCPKNDETTFVYSRKFFDRDPFYNYASASTIVRSTELLLVNSLTETKDNVTPPNWETRPPLRPRTNAKLSVETVRAYPGANDDLIDKREFEYSARSITKSTEARSLAGIFADLSIGRAFGYEVVLSLREATEFLADPTPMQIAWLHSRAFLLDSVSLVILPSLNQAEVSWEAVSTRKLTPPVGQGSTVDQDLFSSTQPFTLLQTSYLNFSSTPFGDSSAPDPSLITVDANGNAVAVGGFVQASANQNQFAHILVDANDEILVGATGDVLTDADDVWGDDWNAIATVDGNVATIDGVVVTV